MTPLVNLLVLFGGLAAGRAMTAAELSGHDVAAIVMDLCDELTAALAEHVVAMRAAVNRQVRLVMAVGLYEAGMSESVLPDVLRRVDGYVASTLGIATPTCSGAAGDRQGLAGQS